jgi:soluble lytic murein transglycosylase-like protein
MTHSSPSPRGPLPGSHRVRLGRAGKGLAAALAILAWAGGALAASKDAARPTRVVLRNGRALQAASWRIEGGFLSIELAAGGRVAVPVDLVLRTEQLDGFEALVATGLPAVDPGEGRSCDPWRDERVTRWQAMAGDAAARHGLEPALVRAVIAAESCGDPRAVSRKGAIGLMQLMPATASDYGVEDPFDPHANVDAGCRHLARLREKLGQDLDVLLAAYNAGEGTVERVGGVPDYRETRDYVSRVKGWLTRAALPARRDG